MDNSRRFDGSRLVGELSLRLGLGAHKHHAQVGYQGFALGKSKPTRIVHLLPRRLERMQGVWAETLEWNSVYVEQGLRWHLQATDPATVVAVTEYSALVEQERLLALEIMEIAGKLEAVTIEKLMAKSDLEIGIEALADPWMRAHPVPTGRSPRKGAT